MRPLLVLCLSLALAGLARAEDPAVALARRVDLRHSRVHDLKARFVQSYRSGLLGRELVESGTLAIQRPGRMLWRYTDPEKKVFISDGKTFWFYVPADRQVIVRDQAGERSLPTLLLSGQGSILAQFEVGLEKPPEPGLQRLRLVPRQPDPEVQRAYLDVDPEARIVGLVVFDAQGNRSRFQFDHVKENVGLSPKLFHFDVPDGVEVVAG